MFLKKVFELTLSNDQLHYQQESNDIFVLDFTKPDTYAQ